MNNMEDTFIINVDVILLSSSFNCVNCEICIDVALCLLPDYCLNKRWFWESHCLWRSGGGCLLCGSRYKINKMPCKFCIHCHLWNSNFTTWHINNIIGPIKWCCFRFKDINFNSWGVRQIKNQMMQQDLIKIIMDVVSRVFYHDDIIHVHCISVISNSSYSKLNNIHRNAQNAKCFIYYATLLGQQYHVRNKVQSYSRFTFKKLNVLLLIVDSHS